MTLAACLSKTVVSHRTHDDRQVIRLFSRRMYATEKYKIIVLKYCSVEKF